MIETRDELARSLTKAAHLEHRLMLQYLFAAYSLKKGEAEHDTPEQAELSRQWEAQALVVARSEMSHLGTVCNLLSAIGEAPQLIPPPFPDPKSESNPFDFELTRYSDTALYRFVRAEQPFQTPRPPRPAGAARRSRLDDVEPVLYDATDQLYRDIKDGFSRLSTRPGRLFIGPKLDQDRASWSNVLEISNVVDLRSAKRAIDAVVFQGEGSPGKRAGSHYETFLQLRRDLKREAFDPARAVASNPRLAPISRDEPHRRVAWPPRTVIHDEFTRDVAKLCNDVYSTAVLMLLQYYSYGGESDAQRGFLRDAIRASMSSFIRPLAELLTTLPVGNGSKETAGPTFEISPDLRVSSRTSNRWTILRERLSQAADDAKHLARERRRPNLSRLAAVGTTMSVLAGKVPAGTS